MKILALETSTDKASLALLRDDQLIERPVPGRTGPSEHILPAIRGMLDEVGLGLSDLDALAFSAGPGAFTGLRLGCGVAQGLALGADKPLISVPTLEALASQCAEDRVFVAVDARMSELYFAAFTRVDGELREYLEPACAVPSGVCLPPDEDWFGCGSAFEVYGETLVSTLGFRLRGFDPLLQPSAASVARRAAVRWQQGRFGGAAEASLYYVRDKVALTTAERLARGGRA